MRKLLSFNSYIMFYRQCFNLRDLPLLLQYLETLKCRKLFVYNWRDNIVFKTLLKNYIPYLLPLSQDMQTDSSSPCNDSCHQRPPHAGKGWESSTDATWRTNSHSSQHLPAEPAHCPQCSSRAPGSRASGPVRVSTPILHVLSLSRTGSNLMLRNTQQIHCLWSAYGR